MDRRRLALVRGGEETGFRRVGSGYLVAPRLVLTARHVVEDGPGSPWARIDVRVGHPQDDPRRCAASVCWTHPDGRDVALLLLDDAVEVPGDAVRWGRPVGNQPLRYDALGFPSASARGGQHGVEHLRGELPPLAGGVGDQDRYVLDQGPAPDGGKAWSGASGSAVFCQDRLVGVVIHDDEAFGNRRLHACPARSFAGDPGFAEVLERHGGGRPRLEQVGADSRAAAHLEHYLRAAQRVADEHPYPRVIRGVMPPLSDIYVRQRVVRQKSPFAERAGETGLRTEGLLAAASPQPADEVLTGDGISVVIGDSGSGKSSLLRRRLANAVAQWLDGSDEGSPAPVLVSAADLLGVPLSRALVRSVNNKYHLSAPLPEDFFEGRPAPGRTWLVLVDGLDEITKPQGRENVLKTVANAGYSYTFVVATRPVPEAEPGIIGPQVPRYRLEPFRPDELEQVASGWFRAFDITEPEQSTRQFIGALDAAGLTELARVPLTMSMLCQLRATIPGGPLPRGRGEIYRNFVELLRERQYTAGAVEQARAAMRDYGSDVEARAERTVHCLQEVLADLAYGLLFATPGNRPVLDIVQEHRCARRPGTVPERRWRDFLESVLRGTGLLTPQSDDLVFIHQTFVEYFAARHVVGDRKRLHAVFRKTFIHPARHLPGRKLPPGVKAGPWLSRHWNPPQDDPFDGFLLDITPDDHPLKKEFLGRMASRRAGLGGYEFLAGQARLGTSLPQDIIRRASTLLRQDAHDRSLDTYNRVYAAVVLTVIDKADGAELLRELAHDPALDSHYRLTAAKELAELAELTPTEIHELFGDLARDFTLDTYFRRHAMWIATELDPAGSPELTQERSNYWLLDDINRADALQVLAVLDPASAVQRLRDLAHDSTNPYGQGMAINWLAEIGSAEAAEVLGSLALSADGDGSDRLRAAMYLSDIDPIAATELYEGLARDPGVDAESRLRAAELLFRRAPERAQTVLRELHSDTTIEPGFRQWAGQLLFMTPDPDPD